MQFLPSLQQGKLLKRYNRFLADLELLSGEIITVHCPNSGSLKSVISPGQAAAYSVASNPSRKLPYTLEMVQVDSEWVGINTNWPNILISDAILQKKLQGLDIYDSHRREVKYGLNSRIDIILETDGMPSTYIEIKNTTMKRGTPAAQFPDSITSRGTKHLKELMEMRRQGHRAVMIYVIQRSDCTYFEIAHDIDPLYGQTFQQAIQDGIEVYAYQCKVSPNEITLDKQIEVKI